MENEMKTLIIMLLAFASCMAGELTQEELVQITRKVTSAKVALIKEGKIIARDKMLLTKEWNGLEEKYKSDAFTRTKVTMAKRELAPKIEALKQREQIYLQRLAITNEAIIRLQVEFGITIQVDDK